jgi:hypothetical protein
MIRSGVFDVFTGNPALQEWILDNPHCFFNKQLILFVVGLSLTRSIEGENNEEIIGGLLDCCTHVFSWL